MKCIVCKKEVILGVDSVVMNRDNKEYHAHSICIAEKLPNATSSMDSKEKKESRKEKVNEIVNDLLDKFIAEE